MKLHYVYENNNCNYHYSPNYNFKNISKTITTTQKVTTNIITTHSITITNITTRSNTKIIISTKL